MSVTVRTKVELNAALKAGEAHIIINAPAGVWLTLTDAGSSRVEARGSSSVVAWGSSSVEARDSSRVVARDSSSVEARETSRVVARDSSSVEAWETSRVVARDSSSVVARETSRVEAWDSSRVEAWDSSRVEARDSSRVVAWETSSVVARDSSRVVAWETSRVVARDSSRVVAWGSSRVEAWGSSRVVAWGSSRVVARDSSRVEAWGSSSVEAGRFTAVWLHSQHVTLDAKGAVIDMTAIDPNDPAAWCDLKGVAVTDGKTLVYKIVDASLMAGHGYTPTAYPIGGTVTAPDWRADRSCGNGLHFSPTPRQARAYYVGDAPARYLACEVDLSTLVPLDDKCKAPSARVLHEVDEWGDPVEAVTA